MRRGSRCDCQHRQWSFRVECSRSQVQRHAQVLTHIIDVKQDTKLFAVFTQRFNLLLPIGSAMGRLGRRWGHYDRGRNTARDELYGHSDAILRMPEDSSPRERGASRYRDRWALSRSMDNVLVPDFFTWSAERTIGIDIYENSERGISSGGITVNSERQNVNGSGPENSSGEVDSVENTPNNRLCRPFDDQSGAKRRIDRMFCSTECRLIECSVQLYGISAFRAAFNRAPEPLAVVIRCFPGSK